MSTSPMTARCAVALTAAVSLLPFTTARSEVWTGPAIGPSGWVQFITQAEQRAAHEVSGSSNEQRAAHEVSGSSKVWLGVQLVPPPPPMVAQLNLGEHGLMIVNLFKDSPAQLAGLQRFDTLTALDGEPVGQDVREFVTTLSRHEPGDVIKLTFIRAAQSQELELKLSAPPEPFSMIEDQLVYPPEPPPGIRGRILRPGPHGWVMEDVGPLPEFEHLPEVMDDFMLRLDTGTQEARRVDANGMELHVQREPDGRITVRRRSLAAESGETHTRHFADMAELRREDPEAYGLLRQATPAIPLPPPDFKPEPGPGWRDWFRRHEEKLRQWTDGELKDRYRETLKKYENEVERFEQSLREMQERLERSMPRFEQDQPRREWEERFFQGPLRPFRPRQEPAPELPAVRFEEHPDGRITLHLRHTDAELSRSFESADALKQQAPEMFEKYQELQKQIR